MGGGGCAGESSGRDRAAEKGAHDVLTGCLESCTEESLELPIPNHHGKSAAHFFWIMIMHDLYHAGQIRTRRTIVQVAL